MRVSEMDLIARARNGVTRSSAATCSFWNPGTALSGDFGLQASCSE